MGQRRRATYDDLARLPDGVIGEILAGELVATPRPDPGHGRLAIRLSQDLGPFDRSPGEPPGPGGWIFLFEPELRLHGDVVVPDVAAWRRERMPRVPSTAAVELAPDWVCEVLSRATARRDRTVKIRIYEREKVGHVWLIDRANRTIEVFRFEAGRIAPAAVYGEDDKAGVEPFAAITLDLARLWADQPET